MSKYNDSFILNTVTAFAQGITSWNMHTRLAKAYWELAQLVRASDC